MESGPINPARKPAVTPTGVRPAADGGGNATSPTSSQVNTEDTVTLSKQGKRILSKTGGGSQEQELSNAEDQKREFSITDANDVVLKIVDTKTREVVKQIPSEDELQLKDAIRSVVEDIGENNSSA